MHIECLVVENERRRSLVVVLSPLSPLPTFSADCPSCHWISHPFFTLRLSTYFFHATSILLKGNAIGMIKTIMEKLKRKASRYPSTRYSDSNNS